MLTPLNRLMCIGSAHSSSFIVCAIRPPKAKRRVPQVLTHREALEIISHLSSPFSLMARLLERGYDIRTIQELLGHSDVATTEIYTHVLNRGGCGVVSPIDD